MTNISDFRELRNIKATLKQRCGSVASIHVADLGNGGTHFVVSETGKTRYRNRIETPFGTGIDEYSDVKESIASLLQGQAEAK